MSEDRNSWVGRRKTPEFIEVTYDEFSEPVEVKPVRVGPADIRMLGPESEPEGVEYQTETAEPEEIDRSMSSKPKLQVVFSDGLESRTTQINRTQPKSEPVEGSATLALHEIANLKEEIKGLGDQIGKTRESSANIRKTIDEQLPFISNMRESISNTEERVSTIKDNVSTMKEDVSSLKDKVEHQNDTLDEKIESNLEILRATNIQIDKLGGDIEISRSQLEDMNAQIFSLQERMSTFEKEITSSRLSEVQTATELKEITEDIKHMKLMQANVDRKVASIEDGINSLKEETIADRVTNSNRFTDITLGQEEIIASIEAFDKRFNDLQLDQANMKSHLMSIEVLRTELEKMKKFIESFAVVLDEFDGKLDEQRHSLELRMSQMEESIDSVKKTLELSVASQDEIVREVIEKQAAIENIVADTGSKVSQIDEKMDSVSSMRETIKEDIDTVSEEVGSIRENVNGVIGRLESVIAEQQSISDKQDRISEKMEDLTVINEGISTKQREIIFRQEESHKQLKGKIESVANTQRELASQHEISLNTVRNKIDDVSGMLGETNFRMEEAFHGIDERLETIEAANQAIASRQSDIAYQQEETKRLVSVRIEEALEKQEADIKEYFDNTNKKLNTVLRRLPEKKKKTDRRKISYMLRKKLKLPDHDKVLIVTDRTNLNFANLLFDVSRKMNRDTVLTLMDNRKPKEEPEGSVWQAMRQADFVIIVARYSLKDTAALNETINQGKQVVTINKALRVTNLSLNQSE